MWQMKRDQPQKGAVFGFKNRKVPYFNIYSYTPFYVFLIFELIWRQFLKENRTGIQNIALIVFCIKNRARVCQKSSAE